MPCKARSHLGKDNRPRSTRSPNPDVASVSPFIYSAKITAACHAASTVRHPPSVSSEADDIGRREKRRITNRLSARRWRMQKKTTFSRLQEQIKALKLEHDKLEHDRSLLQAELRMQLALARAEARHQQNPFASFPYMVQHRSTHLAVRRDEDFFMAQTMNAQRLGQTLSADAHASQLFMVNRPQFLEVVNSGRNLGSFHIPDRSYTILSMSRNQFA